MSSAARCCLRAVERHGQHLAADDIGRELQWQVKPRHALGHSRNCLETRVNRHASEDEAGRELRAKVAD
eukprot:6525505-Lingulodinium_polyedra.AAC.1